MLYVLLIHATLNSPLGANAALDANRVSSLLPADVTNKIGQINAATKSNSQISQQDVDTIRKEEQAKIDALIKQQKEKAAAQAAQPSPQQNPVTQPSSPVPDPSPSQPGNPQSNRPSYKSIFGSSTSLKASMATWNQSNILKCIFERYSTLNQLDLLNLRQVLTDLSSPFPPNWNHGYKFKDKILYDVFVDFIKTYFIPKKKEWMKTFEQSFHLFKERKMTTVEFHRAIAHIIPLDAFNKISNDLMQIGLDEILDLLHLEDILGYNSTLASELASSPCIAYSSSLLKKEFEFTNFRLVGFIKSFYAVEIQILNLIQRTSYFSGLSSTKLKFQFQLTPGSLDDIISSVHLYHIQFRLIEKGSLLSYHKTVPLLELLLARNFTNKTSLKLTMGNHGRIAEVFFNFVDVSKDKFKFEHVFDAFQLGLKKTQIELFNSFRKADKKKIEYLFSMYPIKVFPLFWLLKGKYESIGAMVFLHNMQEFDLIGQSANFDQSTSNKRSFSQNSLEIFSKLKSGEAEQLVLDSQTTNFGCQNHLSLYIRSVEEILQERRLSNFETILYAFGLPQYNDSEVILGWKNGYPIAILLKENVGYTSTCQFKIVEFGDQIDEICFILSRNNLSFFSGTIFQFLTNRSKFLIQIQEVQPIILTGFDLLKNTNSMSAAEMEELIVSIIKSMRSERGLEFKWDKESSKNLFTAKTPGVVEIRFSRFNKQAISEQILSFRVLLAKQGNFSIKVIQRSNWTVLIGRM